MAYFTYQLFLGQRNGSGMRVLHPPPYAEGVINDEAMTVVSLVVLDFPEQREPKRSVGQVVIVILI